MANMSYCRFRNTAGDLEDCIAALKDAYDGGYSISAGESAAGERMFRGFLSFCRDTDIIDGYDSETVKDMFNNAGGETDE